MLNLFRASMAIALCVLAHAQTLPNAEAINTAINQAIREDKLPGAVLLVGHNGKIVYEKAYGNRSLEPARQAMTTDTIFDIASLTKVVATTTAMMRLYEDGLIRPDDPVTKFLPEFQSGASPITIRNLMTHYSGLRPDLDLEPAWSGYDTGIRRALIDKPTAPPATHFVYSDINYELLGEIIHRLSGMPENEFVKKILFDPLDMAETGYLPAASLLPRIAPTEKDPKTGTILRGVVHDPTARYMGGVAGHAGVFSTAEDLAKFCQMILSGGQGLFKPETVRLFTSAASPAGLPAIRGLGWDIDSPYSGVRGNLFPAGSSFGHTGFTGTSLWIDPASNTYVILLANSVHPHLRAAITPLRRVVATLVAAGVGFGTRAGLDVLEAEQFASLKGKRIGLITNQSGIDRNGIRNVDAMKKAGVSIAALFSPEHGFGGVEDRPNIDNTTDATTGIRIWSLYGSTLRPTPEMLRGIDALVFDTQDLGVRFYTYESTMLYAMQEAAKAHIPFYVLDRPNPLTGEHVEGPLLDADQLSFVGAFPLPLRHGMTIGELAQLENAELHLGADLRVIRMTGWTRGQWFDSTGLPWVNPSPNIRNLTAAILYPGIAMLEYAVNYSVGRGTELPFEQIGADWIKGSELAAALNARNVPGVKFHPVEFTPASSTLAKKKLEGVGLELTARDAFSASRLGIEIAAALNTLYPGKIDFAVNRRLIGSEKVIQTLKQNGVSAWEAADAGISDFLAVRGKYLLYK